MKAAPTDQVLIRKGKIWTAKRRTDHEAIFRVSVSRIFSAAGQIGLVAAVDLAVVIASVVIASVVIASVVAADSAAIVLVAEAADLADSAAEDFEVAADDKNKDLN